MSKTGRVLVLSGAMIAGLLLAWIILLSPDNQEIDNGRAEIIPTDANRRNTALSSKIIPVHQSEYVPGAFSNEAKEDFYSRSNLPSIRSERIFLFYQDRLNSNDLETVESALRTLYRTCRPLTRSEPLNPLDDADNMRALLEGDREAALISSQILTGKAYLGGIINELVSLMQQQKFTHMSPEILKILNLFSFDLYESKDQTWWITQYHDSDLAKLFTAGTKIKSTTSK